MSSNISSSEKNTPYLGYKKAATEFLAAGSSVTAYYPFKSVGQQIFLGTAKDFRPQVLYRGYMWGAIGAHQLFLMGSIQVLLKDFFCKTNESISFAKDLGLGAIAGAFTTITVTPCEKLMINPNSFKALFRGTVPVLFRQSGLGAGMLVCPSVVFQQFKTLFPCFTDKNEKAIKLSSSFVVGAITAAVTQVFEQARMMMQNDPEGAVYKNAKVALQQAPSQMVSKRGRSLFAIRLVVIAVATIVLSAAREAYPKLIFNMENRS